MKNQFPKFILDNINARKNSEIITEISLECIKEFNVEFLKYVPLELIKKLDNITGFEVSKNCIDFLNKNFRSSHFREDDIKKNLEFEFLANDFAQDLYNKLPMEAYIELPLELLKKTLTRIPLAKSYEIADQIKSSLKNHFDSLLSKKLLERSSDLSKSLSPEIPKSNSSEVLQINFNLLENILSLLNDTVARKTINDKELASDILKLYEIDSKKTECHPEKLIDNVLTIATNYRTDSILRKNILEFYDLHISKLELLASKKTQTPSFFTSPNSAKKPLSKSFYKKSS